MATITTDGQELVVSLETWEKVLGLLCDLRVPIDSISDVEVVPDGRRAVTGFRSPGYGGLHRLIGTFRAPRNKQYVCVRRGQPAVKVTLEDQKFRTVLIGSDDASILSERIQGAVPSPS